MNAPGALNRSLFAKTCSAKQAATQLETQAKVHGDEVAVEEKHVAADVGEVGEESTTTSITGNHCFYLLLNFTCLFLCRLVSG